MVEKKRIVMIGSAYPYKNALTYYNTLLYRQMRQKYDVTFISYSVLYPKLLYKKEQRNYDDTTMKEKDVEYILNSMNPFSWISVASKINKLKPDLLILQWQHPYFTFCNYTIIKCLRKTRVLYICHNIFPHERFLFDKGLTGIALKPADYYIVHAESEAKDLLSVIKNANYRVAVHPEYSVFNQSDFTYIQARKLLDIDENANVVLFFGLVREYKGLRYLIEAIGQLSKDLNIVLLITGDFGGKRKEYEEMIEKCGISECVRIRDQFVPTEEVAKYFVASDLVALPYVSATQSGVVQQAYSMERPVVVTRVGGLPDVVEDGVTGYVVEPQDSKAISMAIENFFTENRKQEFIDNIIERADRFSWKRMQEAIEGLVWAK